MVSKYAKNQLKTSELVREISCSLTQTVCGLLVSKYAKNQLKISKLVQKISCDLLVVSKYAKNQLKPSKMAQKISCSPTQSDTDCMRFVGFKIR